MSPRARFLATLALFAALGVALLVTWLVTGDDEERVEANPPQAEENAPLPVWVGDFESGTLEGWELEEPAPGRIQVVDDPVRQGEHAVRFELQPGDRVYGSLELSQLLYRGGEDAGQEWWWAWSTLIPDDMPPQSGWCVYAEWHQTGLPDVEQGPAPINFDCTDGKFTLIVRGGDEPDWEERRFELPDLADGKWHDYLFHVRWSPDPDGLVALWIDGEEVVPETRLRTSYRNQQLYLKIGPYRPDDENQNTIVMYHDAWRQGSERASVD